MLVLNEKRQMIKSPKSDARMALVVKKEHLIFRSPVLAINAPSCRHPRGQIHPQKILLPVTVRSTMAAAMTNMGGGINPPR